MQRLRVGIDLDAPASVVWDYVADIPSHVEWMHDARSITFTSERTFECLTVVGPFRTVDRMEIVEWVEGSAIGIRHVGLVQGTGRFTLTPLGPSRCRFEWDETLEFPWWMVPPVARLVLVWVWRRNLRTLQSRVHRLPFR
ncbi:MAG TPA: SRPBCC family protein [Acidimicrobiales bacterium]|nr:SRPBCC family protein [Acidimicrobiales bacterium]